MGLQPPVTDVSPFEYDEAKLLRMEAATRGHFQESATALELCQKLVESRPAAAMAYRNRAENRVDLRMHEWAIAMMGLAACVMSSPISPLRCQEPTASDPVCDGLSDKLAPDAQVEVVTCKPSLLYELPMTQ